MLQIQVHVGESLVDLCIGFLMDYKCSRVPTACSRCYQHGLFIRKARPRDSCRYLGLHIRCDHQCGRLECNRSLVLLSSPSRCSWSIGDSTYLIEIMKPFTIYRSLDMRILKQKIVTLNLSNKWTVALKISMCTSSQYFNISIHLHWSMGAVRWNIHSTGQHTSYIYIEREPPRILRYPANPAIWLQLY